jgi:glutamate carboxypeptidase
MIGLRALKCSQGTVSAAIVALSLVSTAAAQTNPVVRARVAQERGPFLQTLEQLVSIESGTSDYQGVTRIGDLIATRLRALSGDVEQPEVPSDHIRFETTPPKIGRMVLARFTGTGTKRVLLLAHMDTVYQKGMLAQQPFRIDGDRAYGLGIADNKHGVAVILHTLAILRALGANQYGLVTVLVTPDEEVSSPGSRSMITRLGAEHDVVLSFEGGGLNDYRVRLSTAGIGKVHLKVKGRASHAGGAPEQGRNALVELAHQIVQMRDLSDPATGLKLNWTLANAGSVSNVIPAEAQATADVRVLRVEGYQRIEEQVRAIARDQLIPETEVTVIFERTRPPLESSEAALRLATQAQRILAEADTVLNIEETPQGGGTDAAFAGLASMAPVLEGMGLRGAGAHSNDREFVYLSSIEPKLYLLARLIIEISNGEVLGAR